MLKLLSKIKSVEGCVIELGVATGDNTITIGNIIQNEHIEKKYYGFDTFSGYTDEDISEARDNKEGLIKNQNKGRWNIDPDTVIQRIELNGLSDICEIIIGDIKQTVPTFVKSRPDLKISMVYIDCNAYLPAITALVSLEKNLSNGALLVVDEHQTGGETRALREFIGRKNKDIEIQDTGWEFPHGPKLTARW